MKPSFSSSVGFSTEKWWAHQKNLDFLKQSGPGLARSSKKFLTDRHWAAAVFADHWCNQFSLFFNANALGSPARSKTSGIYENLVFIVPCKNDLQIHRYSSSSNAHRSQERMQHNEKMS